MSRKESLKKSLGISEYPWSSDDEDSPIIEPRQDVHLTRSRTEDPRPSVDDTAGTSGLQTPPMSPASRTKHQAKMDRELFWSILNKTPRLTRSKARSGNVHLSYVSRPVVHTPVPELRQRPERAAAAATADIHRILAFKKLTRNYNNLIQNRSNNNSRPTSSRSNIEPQRSSTSVTTSHVAEISLGEIRPTLIALQPPKRNYFPSYDISNEPQAGTSGSLHYRTPRTGGGERKNERPLVSEPYVLDNSDDDDDEPVETSQPASGQGGEKNNNQARNAEGSGQGHNDSPGSISLEEDVVEVDAPDEPDINATIVVDADNREENVSNEAISVTTNSAITDASLPKQNHGVKRKREGSDDNGEPYSVQEFNQNLLRLLECPVCLEWMEPPIAQCRRGHLVCAPCRSRLNACPVCRTTFSSVRNRAMEGVAEMLRYPCRHGCGRAVWLRRRAAHEASCGARRYHCPVPTCTCPNPLLRSQLDDHFQSKHLSILKIGKKHKFSMKLNCEQRDTWLIAAMDEFFHVCIDVDIRTWGGVAVYVAFIGPKCKAKYYLYEVTVEGQHSSRKLSYARQVHSDLESPSLNMSRQDFFHMTIDQSVNFLRFKNHHCESDKSLDFNVEITKIERNDASKDESES